ncbi:DUF397 domain-containing protein [Streptomyces hyaluromycini]|uniref:DUF397 domain-containing protein n=1 Tax=Streptomyces hyaluromycini TaxID=1377993 RepID=UPI000B5C5203|nr:DUF397 domain-containing protein [Streptomyces hyaluromycini]
MPDPDRWQKSSYSSFGDGDSCVETANSPTRISIRDSKDPSAGTLTFPPASFAPFVEALKVVPHPWAVSIGSSLDGGCLLVAGGDASPLVG